MSERQEAGGAPLHDTVADRIRALQQSLSPAELKLSRALLAHYPAAGLESSRGLADRASVSAPTVLRFLARLGFAKYGDFQEELRNEVQARRASPLTLPARVTATSAPAEVSSLFAETAADTVRSTFRALPEHEFEQALRLLADPALQVSVFGGRFSHLLAVYLDLHLRMMRPKTSVHTPHADHNPAFLADLGRRHLCVVLDFRRYQRDTVTLARAARSRGAKIVLLTDPWLSPIADVADVVLPARVESAGSFDSLVAPTALVEALVAGLHARLGDRADQRMRLLEESTGDATVE